MAHIIPDFFLIGAQKCGTTSLATLLDSLPGICFSRPKEPMFFCRDEVELHPHFFTEQPDAWENFDWTTRRDTLLEGYSRHFAHRQPGDLCGEGSTRYLLSKYAPERIHELNPKAKIIVLLRDPAKRAYSAYWHLVRHGIACEPFTKHLQYEGGLTLRSGVYAPDIERWLKRFTQDQCLFMIYEEMLAQPEESLRLVCQFLGIHPRQHMQLPQENRGKIPKIVRLQLALNWLTRRTGKSQAAIEETHLHKKLLLSHLQPLIDSVSDWNRSHKRPPAMPHGLHRRLDLYYRRANTGLESLIGLDPARWWYETLR